MRSCAARLLLTLQAVVALLCADDKVEEINIKSFEAKRDRWNGYDSKVGGAAGSQQRAMPMQGS
jgi:hypothetical protein